MNYKEIMAKIKPSQEGKSDKYLWNLYEFVAKNKQRSECVFCMQTKDNPNGELSKATINTIIIGEPERDVNNKILGESVSGRSLYLIMSAYKYRYRIGCYCENIYECGFADRTEEFWNNYIKYGACYLDGEHNLWIVDRWKYTDESHRECKWCGYKQVAETHTYVEKHTLWKPNKD